MAPLLISSHRSHSIQLPRFICIPSLLLTMSSVFLESSMRLVWLLLCLVVTTGLARKQSTIECLYLKGHLVGGEEGGPGIVNHRCSMDNQMVYNLPDEVLDKVEDVNRMKSGVTRLSIQGMQIHGDDMVIVDDYDDAPSREAKVRVRQYEDNIMSRSNGQRSVGVRSLMVVRVQSLDSLDVSLSTSELEFRVFDQTRATVANQYRLCSNGELLFLPVVSNMNAPNGVGDLQVNVNVAGLFMSNGIENAVISAFEATYGSSANFDHVMFCMPSGMAVGWKGYTYDITWQSFYEDPFCGYYSLPVHEIGHNLGLEHSTEDGEEYGDRSCLMGISYSSNASPNMCFNGAKMWALGWYTNYRVSVNPARDGPWRGSVVGFVDVDSVPANDANRVVLINVGDLYLVHNRLKNFNAQSIGHGNQLTVVRALSLDAKSDLLEGLRPSVPTITVDGVPLDGTSHSVVIEICERILGDILSYEISIHLPDQVSACGTPLPPPTSANLPTLPPIPPSPNPTIAVTSPPSAIPTPPPTPPPTLSPTLPPTLLPTPLPTFAPTSEPPTPEPTFRLQSPMPSASSGASSPGTVVCFTDRMTVELRDGSSVAMRDLQVGAMVKVGDATYSRVYAFGHRDEYLLGHYLKMALANGRFVELSPDHLIFVQDRAIPASLIQVGDVLMAAGNSAVRSIKQVSRQGAYAPFTTTGTIMVNGILASTYVSLQEGSANLVILGYFDTGISHQGLAHSFLKVCRWIGSDKVIAEWIPTLRTAAIWILNQSPIMQGILLFPLVCMLLIDKMFGLLVVPVVLFLAVRRMPLKNK